MAQYRDGWIGVLRLLRLQPPAGVVGGAIAGDQSQRGEVVDELFERDLDVAVEPAQDGLCGAADQKAGATRARVSRSSSTS